METFLKSLEFWQVIVLTLSILIPTIVGVIILTILITRKIANIKFGKIEMNSKNPRATTKNEYTTRMMLFIEKTMVVMSKKSELLHLSTLKKQMDFAEQRMLCVKGLFDQKFLHSLSTKINESGNINQHEDYLLYSALLNLSLRNMNDIFRSSFKENHFDKLSSDSFDRYVKNKTSVLNQLHTNFFNIMYIGESRTVTRTDIYDFSSTEDVKIAFGNVIKEIYKEAATLKREAKEKMKTIDEDYHQFIEKFIQINLKDVE